ncbi:MAG: NAD-dependent epimerase/dehydratase family protein [Deltaproteobacteria bacterium]|nr:NAD-dependent epimerase/dehydratase family protein [Deltaproteobacteria bacterium]
MAKTLVTGGAGFIGSHVVREMIQNGLEVVVVDDLSSGKKENLPDGVSFHELDITSPELEKVFESERPDYVHHLAAQISVADSVRDPLHDAMVNVVGSVNLLQNAVKYGVKKFIFSSSGGTVYGATEHLPAVEELPFSAMSPYGVTKICMEYYLPYYRAEKGLNYTVLRYSNVYGPRQDPHGEAGVVAIFCRTMLDGRTPTINGDGKYIRDYVYAGDVARANFLAIEKGDHDCFNIGTGVRTDVNQLYQEIAAVIGFDQAPPHGPHRPGDLRENYLNASKASRLLGWEPRISLKDGLARTVDYFRNGGRS